jgi:cytochrome c-type biogenesis protein CcmH
LTILFWLIACSFILVSLVILVPPIWRSNIVVADESPDQKNIKIARDRLAELKSNFSAGGLNQSQYDEQVAELELMLSDDLDIQTQHQDYSNQGRWLVYVLMLLIPVLAVSLYWQLGDYSAIGRSSEASVAEQAMPSQADIEKMVVGLADKLKAEPNNLQGWLMLGKSYKVLERYPEAAQALAHAVELASSDPDVMLTYAEALALENHGNWMGKPLEIVNATLQKQPEHLGALWFSAMANAQQGDKSTAVAHLRKLVALLPSDSQDKQQLQELITITENQSATNQPQKPESDHANAVALEINVTLTAELQTQVKPDATVFVYAQALAGPKMPLAIVRKQVKDLPFSVKLTDADSMSPAMKLSDFNQIKLLARISQSGNAMPKTGDLIGTINQVNLADKKPYVIEIKDVVK